jgi:hypothetical protein
MRAERFLVPPLYLKMHSDQEMTTHFKGAALGEELRKEEQEAFLNLCGSYLGMETGMVLVPREETEVKFISSFQGKREKREGSRERVDIQYTC